MRKFTKIFSRVVVVLLILSAAIVLFLKRGMPEILALTINDVDVAQLANGEYAGEYSKARWNYVVSVTVQDSAITDIDVLNKKMDVFKTINAELTRRIIEQNKITVDTYTGATVTSKAFQKAVENALHK